MLLQVSQTEQMAFCQQFLTNVLLPRPVAVVVFFLNVFSVPVFLKKKS